MAQGEAGHRAEQQKQCDGGDHDDERVDEVPRHAAARPRGGDVVPSQRGLRENRSRMYSRRVFMATLAVNTSG